uniref:Uncharacterized protein n=1 Tax=Rhizophora mucronata TaxID=61149 RepID=A0A2P2NRM1_RHIMU
MQMELEEGIAMGLMRRTRASLCFMTKRMINLSWRICCVHRQRCWGKEALGRCTRQCLMTGVRWP